MPGSYLPQQQEALRAWALNFSALITADPTAYGLVAGDATAIDAAVDAYDASLTAALDPGTRTPATVAQKDADKAAMIAVIRPYAVLITNNFAVSNAEKVALGLIVRDTSPTAIPAPSSAPLVNVVGATPGVHTIRYADSNTPDSRAKPFGVIGLQLFVAVGPTIATDPATASFYGQFTKQPFPVAFDAADNGKIATYWARWVTRTGLVGPWSNATAFTIAA